MSHKVLHLLSQRPSFTGSGVSLEAVVRGAARMGFVQRVVVGTPYDDPSPPVGGLHRDRIHPLRFGTAPLDFPLPGMSDVMPYPSSRFSSLSVAQLRAYRDAWCQHVAAVISDYRPDLIHTRHVWLLSSMVKDIDPDIPVVNHCHATGLRQMMLCPHLADEVRRGCARNERFCVLHRGHADALADELGVSPERIEIVGAGYRAELFHARGAERERGVNLLYAGKFSHAKGLPWLLDAIERIGERREDLVLHVAGDGAGPEAEALRNRMARMRPRVIMHGQVSQPKLAELMRRAAVFVLPSFYEGLPLVLVEALACGCRLVCTDLPGVADAFRPQLDHVLHSVPLPRLIGPDVPADEDLPAFVAGLVAHIDTALNAPPVGDPADTMPETLNHFTWDTVYHRIERVWLELIDQGQRHC